MGEQSEEAVDRQIVPPVLGHRMSLLVAGEDLVEERGAEEGEQSEILQAVPAVRGRIDERSPIGGPHEVTRPQITMHASRSLHTFTADSVERTVRDRLHRRGDGGCLLGREVTLDGRQQR